MILEEGQPQVVRQVISEETSKKVREALEKVVAQGTGKNAFLDGYRVGGKTGTAQKVVNGRYSLNEHIVSFIGFAPADDPKLIVYVAIDNPQGIQFGGVVAAPIVHNIMADALPYLGVQPRTKQVEKEYIYGDTPIVTVPNLVGKTVSDIYEDMNMNFQLASSGSGNTVIRQAPAAGTKLERGSVIRIYLGAGD
jgi:stage V sporulation protein D (sporulation-specific penicillin-binding protein)